MIRIVIENIFLFLLPTFVYLAYVLLTRPAAGTGGGKGEVNTRGGLLEDAPLLYLFAAGVFLVVATLVMFGSNTGGRPNQGYTPPAMKDGRIEPGHVN
jgi:hypothetical protein